MLVLTKTSLSNFHFFSGFPILLSRLKEDQKHKTSLSFSSFFFIPSTNCVLPKIFFLKDSPLDKKKKIEII